MKVPLTTDDIRKMIEKLEKVVDFIEEIEDPNLENDKETSLKCLSDVIGKLSEIGFKLFIIEVAK